MQIDELIADYKQEYLPQVISQASMLSRLNNLLADLPKAGIQNTEEVSYGKLQNYRQIRAASVSQGSINRELGAFRAAIAWASRNRDIKSVNFEFPMAREAGRIKTCPASELGAFLRSAWKSSTQLGGCVSLLALTAQRKQAVLDLKWSQITDTEINFNDPAISHAHRRKLRACTPITGGIRAVLERLKDGIRNPVYVIADSSSTRYRPFDRDFRSLAVAQGLPGLTPHCLRHTAATIAIERGIPLFEVSKLLGHASSVTTAKTYIHSRPQLIAPAVGVLEQAAGMAI